MPWEKGARKAAGEMVEIPLSKHQGRPQSRHRQGLGDYFPTIDTLSHYFHMALISALEVLHLLLQVVYKQ